MQRGVGRAESVANETDPYAALSGMLREAPSFARRSSVWAAGFGGSQSTNGNAVVGSNDTKIHIFGSELGADYLFSPSTTAGVALADDAGAGGS